MLRLAIFSSFSWLALAGCPSSPCDDASSCGDDHHEPVDAPPPENPCGNHVCDTTETTASCPADCPAPPPPEVCGNSTCAGTETADSCPIDCAANVTVENRTTTTIYFLYWWKCGTTNSGTDHLGSYTLQPNYHITFNNVDVGCMNFEADSSAGYFRGLTNQQLEANHSYTWTVQ